MSNKIRHATENYVNAALQGVSGGAIQSDYNQNDSTQPDYIKNRPFYGEKVLVCEQAIDGDPNWDGGDIWEVFFDENVEFKTGDILNVALTENGQIYLEDVPLKVYDDGFIGIDWDVSDQLLDGWNWGLDITTNNNRNCLALFVRDMNHFDPNTIVRAYKTICVQIDEKFIPDTIARKSDVEAVLDELHAYAQALIGGDA